MDRGKPEKTGRAIGLAGRTARRGAGLVAALGLAVVAGLGGVPGASLPGWSVAPAHAQGSRGPAARKTQVVVAVPMPAAKGPGEDEELLRLKQTHQARLVADRLTRRLAVAGIKQYAVQPEGRGLVRVTAYGAVDRALLAGLVVPQGMLEVRPVRSAVSEWEDLAMRLPVGIELRHKDSAYGAPNLAEDAFLWSSRREELEAFAKGMSLGGHEVMVYPEGTGWRTLVTQSSVASHRDVTGVSLHRTPRGVPFVAVKLETGVPGTVREAVGARMVTHLAMVLDGEVVALLDYDPAAFDHKLELTYPDTSAADDVQRRWVQQVAGRLASHIPLALVEQGG